LGPFLLEGNRPLNIFSNVPDNLPEEEFLKLAASDWVNIERIVSTGQQSPEGYWYDQENNEWVLVLAGRGVLEFADGRVVELKQGDYLNIPAHQKHRVKETSQNEPTVWLAVHYR
jgi:cupin 2 domain-containing protein